MNKNNLIIILILAVLVMGLYFAKNNGLVVKEIKPLNNTNESLLDIPKTNYADALAKQSKSVKACVRTVSKGVYKDKPLKFRLEACNYNPNAKINYSVILAKQSKSVKACVRTMDQGVYKDKPLKMKLELCNAKGIYDF